MVGKTRAPLLPIPQEGIVDFTKRIRHITVRYLTGQKPKASDLNNWIVLPLFQKDQDMPLDDDGKTAILLAPVDVLRQLIAEHDSRFEGLEEKKVGLITAPKTIVASVMKDGQIFE